MAKHLFRVLIVAGIFLGLGTPAITIAGEEGLAAHYRFDEGSGAVVSDVSGRGNNGKIQGALWSKTAKGYALEFDGTDDYVDCGGAPSLDIQGALTLSAWIYPAKLQTAKGEAGILGKTFDSYLVTMTSDTLWFYVGGGDKHVRAKITPEVWSQVTATFDGKKQKLYINGQIAAEIDSKISSIPAGKNFFIGYINSPVYKVIGSFTGLIDEAKVYNRALSPAEVSSGFEAEYNALFAAKFAPVKAAESIRSGEVSVQVGKNGGLQINNGKSFFVMESSFSYPGENIGWNNLSGAEETAKDGWKPRLEKPNETTILVKAESACYGLERTVRWRNNRIEIEDKLTNKQAKPVGIIIIHKATVPEKMTNARVGSSAENPTVFFSQKDGDFGIVAEDDIGRTYFSASSLADSAEIHHSYFALDGGRSYTFRYAVYPLKPTGDAYNLVNRVRSDWKANFPIKGPWSGYSTILSLYPLTTDVDALKARFERKRLKVINGFWLGYDSAPKGDFLTREEYKLLMQEAAGVLHKVDPELKVLGCIETDWVTIYPEKMKDGQVILDLIQKNGFTEGTPEAVTRVIDGANLPWKDSIKRDKDGNLFIERYVRGEKPVFALGVYPAPGNYQEKFLLSNAQFLLDEVGLDGFYIDDFAQTARSYNGWDGFSADIDSKTGEIMRRFVHCGLAGIKSRVAIIETARSRGKHIMANGWVTSQAEQSLPVQRFSETQSSVNPERLGLAPGKKPPFMQRLWDGVLGSPIGLGASTSVTSEANLAQGLMLSVICYLRHGMLYYHYSYPALPESGPGSGEYGPINHMFPLTPMELHEGWLKGKERIITAVSLETDWEKPSLPQALLFDLNGRPVSSEGKIQIKGEKNTWHIKVSLNDWSEIAVIE